MLLLGSLAAIGLENYDSLEATYFQKNSWWYHVRGGRIMPHRCRSAEVSAANAMPTGSSSVQWSNFAGHHGSTTFCGKCDAYRIASTFFLRVQLPASSAAAPGADHQSLSFPASTPRRSPAATPRRRRCPEHPLPQRQDHQHPVPQRVLQSQRPSSAQRTSSLPGHRHVQRPVARTSHGRHVQRPVARTSHGHAKCTGRCHGAAAAAPVQRRLRRNFSELSRAMRVSGRRLSKIKLKPTSTRTATAHLRRIRSQRCGCAPTAGT